MHPAHASPPPKTRTIRQRSIRLCTITGSPGPRVPASIRGGSAGGYTTLNKSLTQLWADHVVADPEYSVRMRPANEVQRAAFVRAVYSRRQLREVLVNFWHDHFNVLGTDFSVGPVFVHYDRDVIRANAKGNFRTMLEGVAQSTAMLYYLDNINNSRSGPNENFARELLELHTLGAENYLGFMDPFQVPPCPEDPAYPIGYTDIDVYETSAAFTGWSAKNGHWQFPTENDGTFVYRQSWHDAGPKFLLGMLIYPEQPALKDGRDVLDRLASHPRVAKFICKKLIRRFISDTPKQALIDSASQVIAVTTADKLGAVEPFVVAPCSPFSVSQGLMRDAALQLQINQLMALSLAGVRPRDWPAAALPAPKPEPQVVRDRDAARSAMAQAAAGCPDGRRYAAAGHCRSRFGHWPASTAK